MMVFIFAAGFLIGTMFGLFTAAILAAGGEE